MNESGAPMESSEKPSISQKEVVTALDTKGVEDSETQDLLSRYIEQCEREADAEAAADPDSSVTSNRANIKAAIKVAVLYSKTKKYQDQALESFTVALDAASRNASTADLAQEIEQLLLDLNKVEVESDSDGVMSFTA